MTGMDDLVTWFRAQLDEEDEAARRLPDGYRLYTCDDGCVEQPTEKWADGTDKLPNHHNTWVVVYDRFERLAEVDAKRRILDEHPTLSNGACDRCSDHGMYSTEHQIAPCRTVRLLALPYAGRPGYLPEWVA